MTDRVDSRSHPLAGKRIVITRAVDQAGELADKLRTCGATPILFPTIQIAPMPDMPDNSALDSALRALSSFDWLIFTSTNGVQCTLDRLHALTIDPAEMNQSKIAAVGSVTASALHMAGVRVDLIPAEEQTAERLADQLKVHSSEQRILILQAQIASPALRDSLIAQGAHVTAIPVYRTICGEPDASAYAELRAGVDVLTFTSGSTVRNFADLLGDDAHAIAEKAIVACIGRITAGVAQSIGFRVDIIPVDTSTAGLIDAITKHYDPVYYSITHASEVL